MKSRNLVKVFEAFLNQHGLTAKSKKFLLAVSGGLDSIVMTDLFFNAGLSFAVAHCNFQLRGEESNDDEHFVREIVKSYNVEIFINQMDTLKVAENENISIQMAARKLRYEWFEKLRNEYGFDFVSTAHHREDSTETVLLNITRGSGLEGLKGIPSRNNFVIRPILLASRDAIQEYANEKKLEWREDSSNATIDYNRNFIRHNVIPLLREINPSVHESLQNLSGFVSESLILLEEILNKYRIELFRQSGDDVIIDSEKIKNHPAGKTLLFHLLKEYNFNTTQLESMLADNGNRSGVVFYSSTSRLLINRKEFIVTSLSKLNYDAKFIVNDSDFEVNLDEGTLSIEPSANFNLDNMPGESVAILDSSKIKFPLLLRRWQKGDYFYPLGMEHRKKVSDYFADEKFSLAEKERTLLLVNNNDEIIWIVNHRIDNRYKITDQTTKALRLKFLKSEENNG